MDNNNMLLYLFKTLILDWKLLFYADKVGENKLLIFDQQSEDWYVEYLIKVGQNAYFPC